MESKRCYKNKYRACGEGTFSREKRANNIKKFYSPLWKRNPCRKCERNKAPVSE